MLSDGLYVRVSRRGDETRGLGHGGRRAAERHHLADVLQATVVSVRRKCFRRRRTEAGGKSGGFATLHVAGEAELVRFRVDQPTPLCTLRAQECTWAAASSTARYRAV